MEKLLKIPYTVFNNNWDQLQQFLERKGNPRYELVGNVDLNNRKDIIDLGNLVRVYGDLRLFGSPIQSLGNLEYVDGTLNLRRSSIQSLGNLKHVDWTLNLFETQIESLGNLQYVGGELNIFDTPIQSLGNLQYVGVRILISDDHQILQKELDKFVHTTW